MGSTLGAIGGSLASNIGGGKSSGSGSGVTSTFGTSSGTGSTSQSNTSPFGQTLGWASLFQDKQIQPLLDQFISSAKNALTKGELSGAGIPMAQAAIAQARGAAGATLGSAENFLARSGGANSPFAGQLLSGIAAQGNEATAQAPVDIYKMLLGQIPGFVETMMGQSLAGLGQAGALNNTQTGTSSFTGSTHNVTRETAKQSGGGFTF